MTKKKAYLFLIGLVLLLAPLVLAQNETASINDLCFLIVDRVCGSDGITYQNFCQADQSGVTWTDGTCLEQKKVNFIPIILVGVAVYLIFIKKEK